MAEFLEKTRSKKMIQLALRNDKKAIYIYIYIYIHNMCRDIFLSLLLLDLETKWFNKYMYKRRRKVKIVRKFSILLLVEFNLR